jgi:protein gp37
MAINSSIEWTESTWNPITGCTKTSPGCINCYAERMAKRLQAMGQDNYKDGFKLSIHRESFSLPETWKKPQLIFVNSMSDLFHKDVPENIIIELVEIMRRNDRHIFQILTKRSERLLLLEKKINWPRNVWLGVSVENQRYINRIDDLLNTKAAVKFISFEPLLGPVTKFNLKGIDWVIVGGESGPKARPLEKEWVISIRDYCLSRKTPFFFKQWGGVWKKRNGRVLQGKIWNEWPRALSITNS